MAIDPRDLIIRSLAEEMYTFDTVVDRTVTVREKVINKLEQAVDGIDTISTTDPDAATARLNIITTTLRALSDQEAASSRRVSAKLKHQESKRNDDTSEQVVKLFQSISLNRSGSASALPPIDLVGVSLDLERSLREAGEHINDTELRPDPDDLS